MAEGFTKIPVSDPSKLKSFIEGTTGAVVAILNVSLTYIKNTKCICK